MSDVWRLATDGDYYRQFMDTAGERIPGWSRINDTLGYTQMRNVEKSTQAQIDYNEYLARGNERALADWYRNVSGRSIAYPELSYAGQIYKANTSTARAGFDYSNAGANYYGNLPYRTAGLYGIGSKLSRTL